MRLFPAGSLAWSVRVEVVADAIDPLDTVTTEVAVDAPPEVTCTVVVVCVEASRYDLLLGLGLIYLIGTIVAFVRLRKHLKNWIPLSASLAEAKKDLACLEKKS